MKLRTKDERSSAATSVKISITIPADLLDKMIRLGVRKSPAATKAFWDDVRRREELNALAKAQTLDPRLTLQDIRRPNSRVKRLLGS